MDNVLATCDNVGDIKLKIVAVDTVIELVFRELTNILSVAILFVVIVVVPVPTRKIP